MFLIVRPAFVEKAMVLGSVLEELSEAYAPFILGEAFVSQHTA